jgi:hypothetical protein
MQFASTKVQVYEVEPMVDEFDVGNDPKPSALPNHFDSLIKKTPLLTSKGCVLKQMNYAVSSGSGSGSLVMQSIPERKIPENNGRPLRKSPSKEISAASATRVRKALFKQLF